MNMNCFNCGYAQRVYKNGMVEGVDCSKDNLRFIPAYLIEKDNGCPSWIEGDD